MNTRQSAVRNRATYTPLEYVSFYNIMLEVGENARRAAELYKQRNPGKSRYPDFRVFDRLMDRMEFTGNVVPARDR